MRRQPRPFTVEIRSSPKPPLTLSTGSAVSRTLRATAPIRDLWSGVRPESATETDAKFRDALKEANRIFGKLAPPEPVPHQSAEPPRSETGGEPRVAQSGERRRLVLPDLRVQPALALETPHDR